MFDGYILAQEATDGGASGISTLLFLVVMVGIFWFLFIRPQRKRMREQQQLQSEVGMGDRVQTIGGIQGRVVTVDDDSLVIEIESGRMRVAKRAVAARLDAGSSDV